MSSTRPDAREERSVRARLRAFLGVAWPVLVVLALVVLLASLVASV